MRLKVFLLALLLCLPTLYACSSTPQAQQAQANRPPAPQPSGDSSVLIGQAVGIGSGAPIKKTPVYLARIHWDEAHQNAAYVLDAANSPATLTDQNGYFSFADLPSVEYAIIVGESDGNNDVVRESNGNARIFQPQPGKTIDAGTVQVNPMVQRSGT